MSYLNLDFDFFDHPKTRRLRALLGNGAETLILRIWAHCGKFHPDDGIMKGYSIPEIEEISGWKGEPGTAIKALLMVGMLEQCVSNATAEIPDLRVHDWEEHQGHISMMKARAKAAAAARWGNTPKKDPQAMLKQCSSISSSNASRVRAPGEGKDGKEGMVKYSEGESEGKRMPLRLHGIPSSPEEVIAYGATLNPKVPPQTCRDFFAHYEGQARTNQNGQLFWITGSSNETIITNWKAKLPSFGGIRSHANNRQSGQQGISASRGTANEGTASGYANARAIRKPLEATTQPVQNVPRPGVGGNGQGHDGVCNVDPITPS